MQTLQEFSLAVRFFFIFKNMYKKWCENVSALEEAISQVERDLRTFISKEQNSNIYSYTKLLSYLVVCWCEARIMKLIFEPEFTYTNKRGTYTKRKSFTQDEIENIYSASTLKDKWIKALQIAVSKAYSVPLDNSFPRSLDFTPRSRYNEIENLINKRLLPSIELRNRIAHGQWKQAFTTDLKSFSQSHTASLRTENIVELQLNHAIFKSLAQIIHDLASSRQTFERDFDKNYKVLEQNILNLNKRNYNNYCKILIDKYNRGLRWRNTSNNNLIT